ncbi:MAG: tetratricopeptide repeat protein [Bryobacteraceae bacterium]
MRALGLSIMVCACLIGMAADAGNSDLASARDRQDAGALDKLIAQYQSAAQANPASAEGQYRLALGYSYGAEVAMEVRDKRKSEALAEAGMDAAKKAVSQNPSSAEYHRLLGELCGQVIPANPFFGAMKYGQCARDEIDKAIQLDNKLALAYVSRGVGNFYLPAAMGGGVDLALKDFEKAISLNPNSADAYLWKGVTLRKANRNAEARQALEHAIQLDPNRLWAKEQLQKTPAH